MAMEENKRGQQELDESIEEDNNQNAGNNTLGSENGSSGDDNFSDGSENKGDESKSFTQKQLNKMMAREKSQGRAAALRELGIDPKDQKTISLLQSIFKGKEGMQQESIANDQLAEANRRAMIAEIKAEAMKQNAQVNYVDDIVVLVMNKMEADESSDMSTLIGEFKTKYPTWFEKVADESKSGAVGHKGTGSSTKSSTAKSGKDGAAGDFGKRLAAQRKGYNPSKKSFWG